MISFINKSKTWAFAFITAIFTFVPEKFFERCNWITQEFINQQTYFSWIDAQTANVILSRFGFFLIVWFLTALGYAIFLKFRRWTTIEGRNYLIRIEYGDILRKRNCKRVINFDECFTTQVGPSTGDINPRSICGQYLNLHPNLNIEQLINSANIVPAKSPSKYRNKTRYDSGTLVPNGDDLLMAFAKLDERGKGRFFSRDEYLKCLELLWKELENYYSEKDVCIPILGAGTTSFEDGSGASISQQDLLDMIIWSYKLSSHKIKFPHMLRIVCKKNNGFSINNISS